MAERFGAFSRGVVARLPFGLDTVVAPTLVGFALINTLTFAVDLACLTGLHGALHWPLPAAVTVSYAIALGLNFLLNRLLNFRSHGRLGVQLPVYVAVVVANYLLWVLGLIDLLAAAGVDYRLARVVAAACEAVFLYCALRWVVFRRDRSVRA